MKQCKCGSYALNLHKEGIDQGSLCDRHYWQDRAEKAEKDAARYRWMRSKREGFCEFSVSVNEDGVTSRGLRMQQIPEMLDAAIDAAIAKDAP